jgi:CubicO group peptidase (beta-lactamase class C family)
MLDHVSKLSFEKDLEEPYTYSNLGYTYLGWLLGRVHQQKTYTTLINQEIMSRYSLKDTVFELSSEQNSRLAIGYAGDYPPMMSKGDVISPWSLSKGISAAGGLYSTSNDLLRYLKIQMSDSLNFMHDKHVKKENNEYAGLAWNIKDISGSDNGIIYCKGTIGGHKSFIGFDRKKKFGVVVLQNDLNDDDKIGITLLERLILGLSDVK